MNKKSFILYNDYAQHINLLSNEQAGVLIKNIFSYTGDEPLAEMDAATAMAFSFIKAALDRDVDKYDEIIEKRKEAGRLGGYAKAQNRSLANAKSAKQNLANASKGKQNLANLADNDNDNDNVNDNENIYIVGKPDYAGIISHLNDKAGTRYRPGSGKTQGYINARYNEGYTLEDFKTVIDKKCEEWIGTDMEKFLRPETLFGPKFESYLNARTSKPKAKQNSFTSHQGPDTIDYEALKRKIYAN